MNVMIENIRYVLFDFDGTLQVGDKEELHKRLSEVSRRMDLGLDEATILEIGRSTPDYKEMRAAIVRVAKELNPVMDITEENFQRVNVQVSGSFDDSFYLMPGARETLDYLVGKYDLGLVTTRGGVSLPRLLERHGLKSYFRAVVCRDNCEARKPNPEPLNLGLSLLNGTAGEAVYVGDSQRDDVGAAANAGIISVLVGPRVEDSLPVPNYHMATISGLMNLL